MNLFDRYQRDPLGFDSFNAWMRHHERVRAEMRKVLPADHPLAQDMGPEWLELWLGVQELLGVPAQAEILLASGSYEVVREDNALDCLEWAIAASAGRWAPKRRVVLLDGTIIKEWVPQ